MCALYTAKAAELCQGLPTQIAELLVYVRGLGWSDTPDYAWMKSKIDEAMFERNYAMDYAYDWGIYLHDIYFIVDD